MIFIEYPKCMSCKKIKANLIEKGFEFEERNIVKQNPTIDEIKKWHEHCGCDIKKFFNTSGMRYKELNLKDTLKDMSLEEKYNLLASDGMLVKRPLLIDNEDIYFAREILKF